MSSNVIKFELRPKPKSPRHTPPWLRRLLSILGIAGALLVVWTYSI
ncbi:hypothetical protein CDO22_24505 (plasmid) [Sinorhizobium meliloti]|nr:hypothetical protein CDO22_24505 [Sinorhizobium meliloti]